jgi:predicted permease
MSFMIAILGSVFMVAGIIQTLLTVQRPDWFLIFPYSIGSSPTDFMGLAFTLLGIFLFLGGIVLSIHYAAQRLWYSNALKEGYKMEEEKARAQKRPKIEIPLTELPRELKPLGAEVHVVESKAEHEQSASL